MYQLELKPIIIDRIVLIWYFTHLWHRTGENTVRTTLVKLFYSIFYISLPMSMALGGIISEDRTESIFLIEISLMVVIMSVKFMYIVWKPKEIREFLHRCSAFSIDDRDDFNFINETLNIFEKVVNVAFMIIGLCWIFITIIVPSIEREKPFFRIAFPLDWTNNKFVLFIVNAYLFIQVFLCITTFMFSVIMWYWLINCSFKLKLFEKRIKSMGTRAAVESIEEAKNSEEQNFIQDLITTVDSYRQIRELLEQVEPFLSILFIVQTLTSGACICCSVFLLAFAENNVMEYVFHIYCLVYNISETFMVTYLGNEIYLSSNRLSYSLFESNWIEQPQFTKKFFIIFAETIKAPHVVVVAKVYPLTLETFTKILNSAYSMFNILKKLK